MDSNVKKEHWENVSTTKQETEVSWFQPYPKTSIEFVKLFNLPFDANIIEYPVSLNENQELTLNRGPYLYYYKLINFTRVLIFNMIKYTYV